MATALPTKRPAVPPAPSCRRGNGRLYGWEILSDPFGDDLDEVCACLWMVLRDLQVWTDEAERGDRLFNGERNDRSRARMAEAIRLAPALAPAISAFMRLRADPASVLAGDLGSACSSVWRWAEGESLAGTAAHYAEFAAYLVPDNPAFATAAGFACRGCAWYERAMVWYQRGYQLAVRCKNRREVIRGLIGRGAVYHALGRYDEAREFYGRASRRALRTNKRRMGAVARHYLFTLEAEQGRFEAGLDEVREALNMYPIYDRRVPALAHDFAFLLIAHRYFSRALPLLERLTPAMRTPDERVIVQAGLARAAGARHDYERYRAATEYVVKTAGVYSLYAPAGYVHLAHGARSVGEWDRAAEYAGRAEQLASTRRDLLIARDAAALRSEIAARTPSEQENPTPCPDPVDGIERMFKIRLRRWLAPDRRGTGANATAANVADLERKRL